MRLSVLHTTTYHFDVPKRFVTQSHRLTPSACASQRTLDWSVAADGATFGASFVDGAGDAVSTMTVPGPVEAVAISVEGTVETSDTAGVLRDHRETISPIVYTTPSPATLMTGALIELADRALAGAREADALARAHLLAGAVEGAIVYSFGETTAAATAGEAVERGRGVAQDHAHALIALAHHEKLPARYVIGYLLGTEDGEPYEASHAWAEVHVAGLGWVGFDPANGCCPDERYIRLGSGRDARGAAPIRGVSRGAGAEALDVRVVVAQQ